MYTESKKFIVFFLIFSSLISLTIGKIESKFFLHYVDLSSMVDLIII